MKIINIDKDFKVEGEVTPRKTVYNIRSTVTLLEHAYHLEVTVMASSLREAVEKSKKQILEYIYTNMECRIEMRVPEGKISGYYNISRGVNIHD